MKIIDTKLHVISSIKMEIAFQDLEQKIKTSGNNLEILKAAENTLNKARGLWAPQAVYQWCEFKKIKKDNLVRISQSFGSHVDLDFGFSFQFLTHARYALISVYTAGPELEKESKNASSKGDLLEAYFLDLIGLIVLDQAGDKIREIAQQQAKKLGWGVSPFLSPGSVHGWELEEQSKVCSLLPLEKISVKIQKNAVLSPFKTICCLIGLGPGYDSVQVGTACRVCSKNHDCQIKQN